MITKEMEGFFAEEEALDLDKYIILEYYFESVNDPYEAAAHLCQEQSTVQWKRVGIEEDFREVHGAKVVGIKVFGKVETAPFSVLRQDHPSSTAAVVRIAHPHTNFGPKIPNLLSAVCGEGVFFSPGIAAIKLMNIDFPDSFLEKFEGPRFGVDGIRKILDVYDRPILFGVIKPNLGLPPEDFAELGYAGWLGGLDVAKDDEMLCDRPWSPLEKRAKLLTEARLRAERETGEKKIYLANITDEVDQLRAQYEKATKAGANAVMINTMATGLSAVRLLREHSTVPLVGHFAGTAPSVGVTNYGIYSAVITKLERILGCDVIIMPGFDSRMKTSEKEVMDNIEECLKPLGPIAKTLPVPAGSNWVGDLEDFYKRLDSTDFGIVPGRAVFDHPLGPEGGARGLREGWDAIASGVGLEEYSRDHVALEKSLSMKSHKNKTEDN
jgi:ribulose-bisphosphate carboxylase large chain